MKKSIELFENTPVPKAIAKNAIPAIISMLVIIIYNIADTFFVGQTGDPLQVAAVSITTPVFLMLMAIGLLFGIGGTSVISRALGEGKTDYAKKASSFCFYISIVVGIVAIIVVLCFMTPILSMIGTSSGTIDFSRDYLNCVVFSAPFVIVSTAFSNIIRAEGKSTTAMVGMLIGTAVNIILDPIMIIGMDLGVYGAALATVIGNAVGALFYVVYFLQKKSILSIAFKDFTIKNKVATSVLAIGIPASLNSILMSVSNIFMNNLLATYGDVQVAAMGIAMKVNMIAILLLLGLGQGIQPLLGYCYGAKLFTRFKKVLKLSVIYSVIMGTVLTALCIGFSGPLVNAFMNDPEIYRFGVAFVNALMISAPIIGIMFVFINTLQAMGASLPSLILSLSRQGIVFIPLLFILNGVAGLEGVVYSQPVADFVAIALSAILFYIVAKKTVFATHKLKDDISIENAEAVNE